MQTETFEGVPIHGEFVLVVGLDRSILWETLDDFHGAVELSVDELVRVHSLTRGD